MSYKFPCPYFWEVLQEAQTPFFQESKKSFETMKIKLKHLGPIKQAEFILGDLTIICGGNNTGKTYATYALFGFLDIWQEMLKIEIENKQINALLTDGVVHIDLQFYIDKAKEILQKGCKNYTKALPRVFSASKEYFKGTQFQVLLDSEKRSLTASFERKMHAGHAELFSLSKTKNSTELVVSLLMDKKKIQFPSDVIKHVIAGAVNEIIFGRFFPNPFIASAERTGAAIFRKELNFARNRLLKEVSQDDQKRDPMKLLFQVYQDYALPVERNVEFIRQLETISKKNSFIAEEYPDVLDNFADLLGGEYLVTRNDELYFKPKGKQVKLTMDESSSAVRSLLDIGFYLRHLAKTGDLLIVDEPELNLHPENQRRIARLFARLVNLGVKVFITTHSDYIVKELNTLIMLNHDKPYLKQIAEAEGYHINELISADNIKVYIAEETLIKLDGKSRKSRCQTLTAAHIDPKLGIEARSFDTTINDMNRIQEAIVWGDE
jgi:AAA15 family ATPase/GTPase